MYIALGQGQTAPWRKILKSKERLYSFCPFVASFKKVSLKSDFIHMFFLFFIQVYSPRTGAENPFGSKFVYQHKPFVTLVI